MKKKKWTKLAGPNQKGEWFAINERPFSFEIGIYFSNLKNLYGYSVSLFEENGEDAIDNFYENPEFLNLKQVKQAAKIKAIEIIDHNIDKLNKIKEQI